MNKDKNDEVPDCPKEFPDEVVYKIWPGTRPFCDCTKNHIKFVFKNNGKCPREEKYYNRNRGKARKSSYIFPGCSPRHKTL